MGLISSRSVSITRYRVEGNLEPPVLETIAKGLKHNAISEIDEDISEKTAGWTSFQTPFQPDFESSGQVFGTYLVFSLRIDKKNIPSKIIRKHLAIEEAKRLAISGRQYLSGQEKKLLKEQVLHSLCIKTPSTPNIYDVIWNYEEGKLWFLSNLKSANEALETLFTHSFKLSLIRLFPYTTADLSIGLSNSQRDLLSSVSPTGFMH